MILKRQPQFTFTLCPLYLFLLVVNEYSLMQAQARGSGKLLSWGVSKAICVQMSLKLNKNQLGPPLNDKSKYPSTPKTGCSNLSWAHNKCASIGRGCSSFSCVAQDRLVTQNSRTKLQSALRADEKTSMWPLQSIKIDPALRKTGKISREYKREDPMLPDDVVPTSYKLQIRPILDANDVSGEQWTAPGKVEIDLSCVTSTKQIVVKRDAKVLIEESTIQVTETGGKGDVIPVTGTAHDAATTFYTINLGRELVQGETYRISISFTTPVDASFEGLYRAQYIDENGQEHRIATTHFEPLAARQMFPCFDEPRRKTPFTVSIGYKKGIYTALGNTPAEIVAQNDSTHDGWVWDHLKETVPMPTYLVAIVVSDLAYVDAPSSLYEKPVRVYAEPHQIAKGLGVTSANEAGRLMARHQKEYVHPYEMPKMDLIAIPDPYFIYGGMENWGAVIFRENMLLFNPEDQPLAEKYGGTSTLSHELAHQWFGNLVTCQAWEYFWLNEGFATYAASYGVEDIAPEHYESYERLQYSEIGLQFDLLGSLPISTTSTSIAIVYFKGATIIRMMEGFLGKDTLAAGLVNYLKTFAYKSTVPDDLFEQLTARAVQDGKLPPGKTVKDIMDTWTLQPGFPLIRVSKLGASQVQIRQERFQNLLSGTTNNSQQELYEVPLSTATRDSAIFSNYTPTIWMSKSETSTVLSHDTSKWIFINPDRMGYYRVLYDKDLLQLIMDQLKMSRNAISPISRSQLIRDYFNFYKNGYVSLEEALNTTVFLKNDEDTEDDYSVWSVILEEFAEPLAAFQAINSGPKHSLAEYLKPKIEAALRKIGSVPKPEDKGTLVVFKYNLLDWACAYESDMCITYAQETMAQWINNPSKYPFFLDTRLIMYCTSVAKEGKTVVDFLRTQFAQIVSYGQYYPHKFIIARSLSCAREPALLKSLLQESLNTSMDIGQREEWGFNLYTGVAANPIGRPVLLKFLDEKENVDRFNAYFHDISYIEIYKTLGSYVFTEAELSRFVEVIKKNTNLDNMLPELTQKAKQNLEWMISSYKVYDTWFKTHSESSGSSEEC